MPIQSLHTGYTGLVAGQIGIDTTSNNIANANTEGYTRQRVDQRQAMSRDIIVGRLGTGTTVDDITRARDAFLDDRARAAMAQSESFAVNAEMLSRAESLLAEPDFGITTAMDDLWAGFEDLALDPSDTGRRTAVLNQLEVLTGRFNAVAEGMSKLVDDAGARIMTQLTDANQALAEIADLNKGILRAGATGSSPNDLIDRRDLLLDDVVAQLGARVTQQEDGSVRVSLNGLSLVDGSTAQPLSWDVATNQLLHQSGHAMQAAGEIGGLQMFVTDDVPTIMSQLDQLAIDLHDALNTRHQAGFVDSGVSGGALLSYSPGTPAETLQVVLPDVTQFAVSGVDGTPFPIHDGDNAQSLSRLRDDLFGGGGTASLLDAARELVAEVGGRTAGSRAAADAQTDLLASAELARGAAHGINLDEEMIELIRYQRAYEAAARVVTAADQALDTLINRTGIVGR